jgi:hypothetical protein
VELEPQKELLEQQLPYYEERQVRLKPLEPAVEVVRFVDLGERDALVGEET